MNQPTTSSPMSIPTTNTKAQRLRRSSSSQSLSGSIRLKPVNKFKVVVLGGRSVGTSSLTLQLLNARNKTLSSTRSYGELNPSSSTLSSSPQSENLFDPAYKGGLSKEVVVDRERYRLGFFDFAGQDLFSAMRDQHLRNGDAYLLVFDICNLDSFREVFEFRRKVLMSKDCDAAPMVLIGNKIDLEANRSVSTDEARALAELLDCPYIETSVKKKINMNKVLLELVKEVRRFNVEMPQSPAAAPSPLAMMSANAQATNETSTTKEKKKSSGIKNFFAKLRN